MKHSSLLFFTATIACSAVYASPLDTRGFVSDTANDMNDKKCKDVAVIFARGTFDSGNIGVFVGPTFQEALGQNVAFQGVTAGSYKADLDGYLNPKGQGADQASSTLAKQVKDYAKDCPDTPIVISGWSQGGLVAHRGLGKLDPATQKRVVALVTFGDPWHLFENTPVPGGIAFKSFCVTGTDLDPLCAKLPGDWKFPRSKEDIIGPFSKLPSLFQGAQQLNSARKLVQSFPGQLASVFGTFIKTVAKGEVVKLMLMPQHFTYGNNGMAKEAAQWVLSQSKGKAKGKGKGKLAALGKAVGGFQAAGAAAAKKKASK